MNLPLDINAETLYNHLPPGKRRVELKGTHKRNAYEEILGVRSDEDGTLTLELSREGLYDILPEALFHPIDRFDNIPANEYKERFAEEVERQQAEESNARKYFAPFDSYVFALKSELTRLKDEHYGDNSFLSGIICDRMPERYRGNRFVEKMKPFVAMCSRLRGDRTLLTLVLRKVLMDEGVRLRPLTRRRLCRDVAPDYACGLDADGEGEIYLGNEFYENTPEYELEYWNEEECTAEFLNFVAEMEVFEDFVNDYFTGIETAVKFRIGTTALPARLSDELCRNYLDYNTNL